ncbi:hypothetical protein [Actinomycetospora flava]|uniref:Uncharacterized protein n=1 Tax=Actinomycetospora flava TaxID=3129232 RepID=A0ABU8MA44_9PSEU
MSACDGPAVAALVVGLVLLVAPAPLQVSALLALVGALAAWTVSDRLARRLTEEDVRGRP